ncbi:MAG: sterol desaturase family protein [Chitinophagaceae bacterium]|nr:sterol desaturase family protein [Chitinophagaceae bacterium]MCW5926240.1 sterol desaturase family protein [Chitinophagaceae bacterium]
MEQYGKILLIAMPVFLVLVLFEKWYGWRKGFDTVRTLDMISSLTSGVTNVTKDVLGLSVAILSYEWMVRNWALTHINTTWLTYVIVFIVLDFAGYLTHALQHKVNFFWNAHIIHHSSEEFNLACALRQSISVFIRLFAILLLPAALLGIAPKVIAIVAPLHLFAQFWYHTRHIGKMGFLEKFIVTPSHHRVHHAINPEYMDKNFGQIFIFWDKLFGTFREELKEVPPVYGVTRPVRTWNPIKINFQHMALLVKDAWRAESWADKFRIFYKPTGWRPADVANRYPVYKIADVYHFEKYDTPASPLKKAWCWLQTIMLLLLISYFFGNIAGIGAPAMFIYGAFIFLYVYSLTDLMDGNPSAWIFEALKLLLGCGIIYYYGGWFGIEKSFAFTSYFLVGYFIISFLASLYFSAERKTLHEGSHR